MARIEFPEESNPWLTDEIATLLKAIRGQHVAKKRTTVVKLAFARANQTPLTEVFDLEDTCSETIWYTKWQYVESIKAAYEACYARALDFADQETITIEAYYRRLRRRSVAQLAAEAPEALAAVMNSEVQRGSDRISAANALMGWADPDAAEKVRPASPASSFEQQINTVGMNVGDLSDEELDRAIARELEAGGAAGGETPPERDSAAAADPGSEAAEAADA